MKKSAQKKSSDASRGKRHVQEFFRLPRAEFLLEEIRQNPSLNLEDIALNLADSGEGRVVLQVEGQDMRGAGILHHDYVVVEPRAGYQEGDILAVKLGEKILVRRYFRAADRIRLESDPPSRQTIIVEKNTPDFAILGKVIQVIREV